jgi:hypothetical protein
VACGLLLVIPNSNCHAIGYGIQLIKLKVFFIKTPHGSASLRKSLSGGESAIFHPFPLCSSRKKESGIPVWSGKESPVPKKLSFAPPIFFPSMGKIDK